MGFGHLSQRAVEDLYTSLPVSESPPVYLSTYQHTISYKSAYLPTYLHINIMYNTNNMVFVQEWQSYTYIYTCISVQGNTALAHYTPWHPAISDLHPIHISVQGNTALAPYTYFCPGEHSFSPLYTFAYRNFEELYSTWIYAMCHRV